MRKTDSNVPRLYSLCGIQNKYPDKAFVRSPDKAFLPFIAWTIMIPTGPVYPDGMTLKERTNRLGKIGKWTKVRSVIL